MLTAKHICPPRRTDPGSPVRLEVRALYYLALIPFTQYINTDVFVRAYVRDIMIQRGQPLKKETVMHIIALELKNEAGMESKIHGPIANVD